MRGFGGCVGAFPCLCVLAFVRYCGMYGGMIVCELSFPDAENVHNHVGNVNEGAQPRDQRE